MNEMSQALKILAVLNTSNASNMEADSGFIFLRSILSWVLDAEPSWSAIVLCTPETPDIHARATRLPLLRASSKYQVRFDFPWTIIESALLDIVDEFTILYSNQPEITANLLSLIQSLRGRAIPTVSYVHYLAIEELRPRELRYDSSLNDWGLASSVLSRQCEVLLLSQRVLLGSTFACNLLMQSASNLGICSDPRKVAQIAPPLDRHPADCVISQRSHVILYNSRLYSHYSTAETFSWLNEVALTCPEPFRVVVTDPTSGQSALRQKLDPSGRELRSQLEGFPFVDFARVPSRAEYHSLIERTTIGIAPMRPAALWSMAAVDVMAAGKPVLAPDSGPFPEMLSEYEELLYSDKTDFQSKLTKLLTDDCVWRRAAEHCLLRSREYTTEQIGERFRRVFREVAIEQ